MCIASTCIWMRTFLRSNMLQYECSYWSILLQLNRKWSTWEMSIHNLLLHIIRNIDIFHSKNKNYLKWVRLSLYTRTRKIIPLKKQLVMKMIILNDAMSVLLVNQIANREDKLKVVALDDGDRWWLMKWNIIYKH